jgi:hypothetical protein
MGVGGFSSQRWQVFVEYPAFPLKTGFTLRYNQHQVSGIQEREASSQYHDASGKAIRFLFKIEMNSLEFP